MNSVTAAVFAVHLDGRRVLFGRYEPDVAESTASALRGMGMGAEVVDSDLAPDLPGTTVHGSATPWSCFTGPGGRADQGADMRATSARNVRAECQVRFAVALATPKPFKPLIVVARRICSAKSEAERCLAIADWFRLAKQLLGGGRGA